MDCEGMRLMSPSQRSKQNIAKVFFLFKVHFVYKMFKYNKNEQNIKITGSDRLRLGYAP